MMIDDDHLAAQIENALGIIVCAFENAIDNNDPSELEDEIKRGISELWVAHETVIRMFHEAAA